MTNGLYTKCGGLRKEDWRHPGFKLTRPRIFRLPYSGIGLAYEAQSWEGAHVNSTLKIQAPDATTLVEKIKAELKKRAELKAKRMLLKAPKRRAKR
jgi:hypothetical protein